MWLTRHVTSLCAFFSRIRSANLGVLSAAFDEHRTKREQKNEKKSKFPGKALRAVLSWATPPVRLGVPGRNSGNIPERHSETLSEHLQAHSPREYGWDPPKPYHNSRHLRLPENLQNSLHLSTAGDASFSRSGSGEGLSELFMEFKAVLGSGRNAVSRVLFRRRELTEPR